MSESKAPQEQKEDIYILVTGANRYCIYPSFHPKEYRN